MKCNKCGMGVDKSQKFCMNCGNDVFTQKKAKKSANKKKKILIIACSAGCLVIALALSTFLYALPTTGNDFWTEAPEYTIVSSELEAGVPCKAKGLIEINKDTQREWELRVKDNNIDTSELGTYSVIYLLVPNNPSRLQNSPSRRRY